MNKTKVLYIRIEENDLQLFQEAAKRLDVTTSKFIRGVARDKANEIINYGGVNRGQTTENAGSTNPK